MPPQNPSQHNDPDESEVADKLKPICHVSRDRRSGEGGLLLLSLRRQGQGLQGRGVGGCDHNLGVMQGEPRVEGAAEDCLGWSLGVGSTVAP